MDSPKKKRGRPRKNELANDNIKDEEKLEQPQEDENESEQQPQKEKRVKQKSDSNNDSGLSYLAKLNSDMTKKFGKACFVSPSNIDNFIPRVSTGIWALDKATGGGLPIGRFVTVYGEPSTGKTSLYLRAIAHAQRMCGNCYRVCELVPGEVEVLDTKTGEIYMAESMVVGNCECGRPRNFNICWLDLENAWHDGWAEACGVLRERLYLSNPSVSEEASDILVAMINEGKMDISVLDSLAQMTPLKETEISTVNSKDIVGVNAKIINSLVRKTTSVMNLKMRERHLGNDVNLPSIWLVNQTRMKIGVMFGTNLTTPGGKAPGFAASIEIFTKNGKGGYKVDDEIMETQWVELGFEIKKSKISPARQGGQYRICLTDADPYEFGQVLDHSTVLFHAQRHGLVEQLSDKKYVFNGEEFIGKNRIIEKWAYNPELYEQVKRRVLQEALKR